ncbi:hypothetical protein C4A69_02183 [Escherichia coli]|nr:hypothetical protein C4A69_02183 [Escherichia coli]
MTFCGDLPFVPSGINHHPFENLRRKGHHCHGRKRLSGGRPQKFLPAFGQKLLWDVHFTPGLAETVVAVCAPGDRDSYGCVAPDTTTGRDPPQRRRARARNGVAPHIPAAFCRDAGSAGHGATEAARPERSLQARGFASGMEARQGGDSFAGSVHDSPPRQGDARKRHKQENNNIISNRQMTGLKRQKPPSERPRNGRGGASARPLPAPPARGLFPARADGHLSSRLPGVIRHADE